MYVFSIGGVNPGAQMPHGPMRLGPDTTNTLVNIGAYYVKICACFH